MPDISTVFKDLSRKEVGALGERVAALFLEKQGFTVREKNFRRKAGEIDIIVLKRGVWHFVEVKTVVRHTCQPEKDGYAPEDLVHEKKLETITRVAELYAMRSLEENDRWQVDVVAVTLESSTGKAYVKYLPGVL